MRQYVVSKANLAGEIVIPASKSHTLRAILFGALGNGKSIISDYLPSTDSAAMVEACRLFGAEIDVTPSSIEINGINGKIECTEDVIQAGNSGIVLRFCAAIGALAKRPVVITGDHSIRHQRPIKPLLDGLSQLGVSTATMRGDAYAPVIIQGPIVPGFALVEGVDSQPVSALLIASAFAAGPVELEVRNPGEKPWISLTLNWFDRLGIPYENEAYNRYRMKGGSRYEGFEYKVPGDFSTAAFPIAAALITQSELTIKNIDIDDLQGDKEIIEVFKKMGGKVEIDKLKKILHVKRGCALKGIAVDINDFVDAITIIAVVACFAAGETRIYNAAVARQKECDRIHCIASELRKMGADITEHEDGLSIRKSNLKGSNLFSHHDHRMVMSLIVAGLGSEGETIVSPVECVSKTFPSFMKDFNAIGGNIREGS